MPISRLIWSIAVFIWLMPAAAFSQSDALAEAIDRYLALYGEGRYQDAVPIAEFALQLAEEEAGDGTLEATTILNDLAVLYGEQGRYAEAEPLLRLGDRRRRAVYRINDPSRRRVGWPRRGR